jgi:hypothetical protein
VVSSPKGANDTRFRIAQTSLGGFPMSPRLYLLSRLVGSDAGDNALEHLADRVKATRESLRRLIPEPDSRVREVLDPILRRRLPVAVLGLAGLTFAVGGMVGLVRRMKRPAPGPVEKARKAVARMVPISWPRLRQALGGKSWTQRAQWSLRWPRRRVFVRR